MFKKTRVALFLPSILIAAIFVVAAVTFVWTEPQTASGQAYFPDNSPLIPSMDAEAGRTIFETKCSVCHTIGGGAKFGPDLKGVTGRKDRDELVSFIVSPTSDNMPKLGVTEAEARDVLLYIDEQSGTTSVEPVAVSEKPETVSEPAEEVPQPVQVSTGDADSGRDIFTGKTRLENQGAACFSCHTIDGVAALGGGAFAKDLSGTYQTIGEAGLTAVLQSTPFPVMRDIYGERPLTDGEIADIVAFLQEAGQSGQSGSSSPVMFVLLGLVGCLVILAILHLLWRGRLSGVRQLLVDKGGSG